MLTAAGIQDQRLCEINFQTQQTLYMTRSKQLNITKNLVNI